MARPSSFTSEAARAEYCRWYDEAVALCEVRVDESDIETSFGTTHVLTAGDPSKPTLVALPGMATSSTMWLPLLPALAAANHVRLVDVVGDVGKSVAAAVLSSPARIAEWIDETLDQLGVNNAAFVGASTGAWMATHYAMAHPERVERLALVCPAGIVSAQHPGWLFRAFMDGRVRASRPRFEAFVESLAMASSRQRMRSDPWRPIIEQLISGPLEFRRGLREPRPVRCNTARLAASGISVVAIIGRQEALHDGKMVAERFRHRLPGAQVHLIEDANHLVFIDQQDTVDRLLRGFLSAP
ncbi:alpha/beta fold hydrolase [[Mycobacterium] nativiensis]|uniref:Alpha/beta hydrolase n=1 Tax=[Mycobacterium] nativiensis TaxID=2855503 RepID=A0ABU5Y255_9MYCO|nr:alpha/beta hydrolase [Mycolicibacter sp. MYC340]MEB3034299.1 alpha/beta hydrolase [Mycolicibacter sp. MYC340]